MGVGWGGGGGGGSVQTETKLDKKTNRRMFKLLSMQYIEPGIMIC